MSRIRRVAVAPEGPMALDLAAAVERVGARLVPVEEAEALVWAGFNVPDEMPAVLAAGVGLEWVGLPFAGIEPYVKYLDDSLVWTCAKGVYATPVAEHVIAMALTGMRGILAFARQRRWVEQQGTNLIGARVTIFGGGGITRELIRLLAPFGCSITVVRRRSEPMDGVTKVVGLSDRLEAVVDADLVVLALALTPETRQLVDSDFLAAMSSRAWLVNVARGGHVDTVALVDALRNQEIAGAALDVTDPEPLPDDHDLWDFDNLVISPHVGNTLEMGRPLLIAHVERNVRRFCSDETLEGLVDVTHGY